MIRTCGGPSSTVPVQLISTAWCVVTRHIPIVFLVALIACTRQDGYPQRFDCSNPETWIPVVTTYHEYHAEVNPSQPWYMPEFQAGAYDPWAGPGYDACAKLTGADFEDVFYKENWAANAKLISYYMLYGYVVLTMYDDPY